MWFHPFYHLSSASVSLDKGYLLKVAPLLQPSFSTTQLPLPLQYSCLENPMKTMKEKKNRTLKDELPRSVDAQHVTGDQWRNNSRKNEEMESRQKQHRVLDITGDGRKAWCCKEQYWIGTWNVRSMNQGNWKRSNRRWQEWMSIF